MNSQQYQKILTSYQNTPTWRKNLSYAVLSLQVRDGQQHNLSSDYHDEDQADYGFIDQDYTDALLKGGILKPEDLTADGKFYLDDLHLKEYRHMEQNQEAYTQHLWNPELFRAQFRLWSWIVWEEDFSEEIFEDDEQDIELWFAEQEGELTIEARACATQVSIYCIAEIAYKMVCTCQSTTTNIFYDYHLAYESMKKRLDIAVYG